jgi:hypothetical protein
MALARHGKSADEVGGDNSAGQAAVFLAGRTRRVCLLIRGDVRLLGYSQKVSANNCVLGRGVHHHGRTILNLASRSTSAPLDSPKATISSGILLVIMPPKLNILEPLAM